MRVSIVKIQGYDAVQYEYTAGGCVDFCFNLLCEVGEPYKEDAEAQLMELCEENGSRVETIEIDSHPWLIDIIA